MAVDWDKSLYLQAEPGKVIVTARHPKLSTLNASAESLSRLPDGRKDVISSAARFVYALPEGAHTLQGATPRDVWYVGAVGGAEEQEVSFRLDFLTPGVQYEATVYADAPDAHYADNPQAYRITKQTVTPAGTLPVTMAPGGGFAVSFRKL